MTFQFQVKTNEASLVHALKSGDESSFECLVREYGGYLMTITRRYLKSEADVQDSVQDTFLQAYQSFATFEGRSSIKSWLHRIAVNTALMRIRSKDRRPEALIDDTPSLFDEEGNRLESEAEFLNSIESDVIDKQSKESIRNHINELSELPRKLLMLRDIEGYSTDETAELMNMSVTAVKTGLHRARRALKQAIQA